jgi:predicted lipoprotein with Yx(FWY)xxD motif
MRPASIRPLRTAALIVAVGLLAFAGCGGDDSNESGGAEPRSAEATMAAGKQRPAGTRVALRGSDFGSMLWGPKRQAIYVFQRDGRNRSRCFGECAKAWPPVFTEGKPVAGRGVRKSLLGSIRRGGRRQVTYAGKPLYYYAHEGPGQVLCHNVNLNGGLWWVVGPDGKRRA